MIHRKTALKAFISTCQNLAARSQLSRGCAIEAIEGDKCLLDPNTAAPSNHGTTGGEQDFFA